MDGRHEIEKRREQIAEICREHQVARLLVFGSVLREDFNPETSDIDFLVEFLPEGYRAWMSEFADLQCAMETLFRRKIDVISERGLKNPYLLKRINNEKELLYAA